MIFAIDLDGTAFAHPELFAALARGLQADGHTVGVLTGRAVEDAPADLTTLRDHGFPTPHFFIARTPEERASGRAALEWKRAVMEQCGIDWLFDDLRSHKIVTLVRAHELPTAEEERFIVEGRTE